MSPSEKRRALFSYLKQSGYSNFKWQLREEQCWPVGKFRNPVLSVAKRRRRYEYRIRWRKYFRRWLKCAI